MKRKHFVSIIVVNYNGKHFLDECLTSLTKLTYPQELYEVIVVDNNSTDDSVPFIHKNFPQFYLVRNEKNLGFVGGNRVGLRYANGEYIVLLNSDTKVDSHWLDALVDAAEKQDVGIVNSKLFYATPFLQMSIRSTTVEKTQVDGSGDFSPLGVLLEDVLCSKPELTDQVWYEHGFYKKKPSEIAARWTKENASILVPFDQHLPKNTYTITVHAPLTSNRLKIVLTLELAGKTQSVTLDAGQVKQFTFSFADSEASKHFIWLVQNAGNAVFADGYGRDRGSIVLRQYGETREFYERDSRYFQKPTQLLAFCGASCLLKRSVIEKVGFFDEHYYMYYEDVDLSLRAWLAGFEIVYEPSSIVYHKHKASTKAAKGEFMLYQVEKNHLYFLLTFFSFKLVFREFILLCIRWAITYSQMTVYLFRNNLPHYELLRQRHLARKDAVADFLKNSVYFLSKRGKIRYDRPDAKKLLFANMY